ncbi:MAG: hypothetical protein C0184_13605, partial [Chloroflexus aggregans]
AVDTIYRSGDLARIQALIEQYQIDYIYIGALERERYSADRLAALAQVGEQVFAQDEVVIYRVRR